MESWLHIKPIQHTLLQYLSTPEIANLYDAYPNTNIPKLTEKTLIKAVQNALLKVFHNNFELYEQFNEALFLSNACISGSFLLQAILNEDIGASDIDIYLDCTRDKGNYVNFGELENFLFSLLYGVPSRENIFSYEPNGKRFKIDTKQFTSNNYPMIRNANIQFVREYKPKKYMKFQLIYVDRKKQPMFDYISSTYDFDFCKNVYDGHQLMIRNLNSILTKTVVVKKFDNLNVDRHYRCLKYIKKGFTLKGYVKPTKLDVNFDAISHEDGNYNSTMHYLERLKIEFPKIKVIDTSPRMKSANRQYFGQCIDEEDDE
jgi:hypothetical protein